MALIARRAMVSALVFAAVFGLYMAALAPMQHEVGCLFASGETAVCVATLEHITHWQSAFAAILAEFFVIAAIFVFFVRDRVPVPKNSWPLRHRLRVLSYIPPQLQEAFSNGILNPKIF